MRSTVKLSFGNTDSKSTTSHALYGFRVARFVEVMYVQRRTLGEIDYVFVPVVSVAKCPRSQTRAARGGVSGRRFYRLQVGPRKLGQRREWTAVVGPESSVDIAVVL